MYGPLPVPCLRGLLSEEEIHFVVVSVIIIWDEVRSDELRVCRGRRDMDVSIKVIYLKKRTRGLSKGMKMP